MNLLYLAVPIVPPTFDTTFLLVIALITMLFIAIGLLTQYKIYLLFSIGGLIAMIAEFQDFTGIVIALVGVIIFNLWYATLGGLQ
jgi:hypothetical protein